MIGQACAPPPGPEAEPAEEIAFLAGMDHETLRRVTARARNNQTAPQDELTAAGLLNAEHYVSALATELGAAYNDAAALPGTAIITSQGGVAGAAQLGMIRYRGQDGTCGVAVTPRGTLVQRLLRAVGENPAYASHLTLMPPQAFLDAILAATGHLLAGTSARTVDQTMPGLSAREGMARWQAWVLALGLATLAGAAAVAPQVTAVALLVLFSVFFMGVASMRLLVVLLAPAQPTARTETLPDADLPVYSVLVPLYREANVVPRLIAALNALDYPRAKLDIKLIVEADDVPTSAALRAMTLPSCYEIVTLPDGLPKTKPRALNFALAAARGSLVTIFDAEDRPEPDQLRRAATAFHIAPPELACLQARLAWYNWTDSWFTRQLAIEYASLFDVFLPALERLGLPLPLGGTSNHFRVSILREVGGWDAWNVTEDADLGLRLARAGYRCGTMESTTWEEAPNTFRVWLGQRTRWLKGWMQTYMVHMRRPGDLARRLGPRGFAAVQLIMGGIVVSALVHPLFFVLLAVQAFTGTLLLGFENVFATSLIAIGTFNLVAGYAAGVALGLLGLRRRAMPLLKLDLALLWIYWLVISLAAYRAAWELAIRPFHWEKTQHGLDWEESPIPRLAVNGASATAPLDTQSAH